MPLNVNGLRLAESLRTHYRIVGNIGLEPRDLLDPAYWVHVSQHIRKGDRIEVIDNNFEWFAEVLVIEVGKTSKPEVRVSFIHGPVSLSNDADVKKPEVLEARWGGPNALWRVVRIADGHVLKDNIARKEDAEELISEMAAAESKEAA